MLFNIVVSIKPLAFIVAALVPAHTAEIKVLLPTDKDMHEYALTVADIKTLEQAETLFWLDAKSEPFIAKLEQRLPAKKHWVAVSQTAHAWLDIEQIKQITPIIALELGKIYPAEKNTIDKNAKKFLQAISARQQYWQNELSADNNQPFLLGHDAFVSFAENIGLKHGLLYRASNDHGHAQAGLYELLDLQKRIVNKEIVCALQEPEVDFKPLAKRYPQLKLATLDIFASKIAITENAYVEFFDNNAKAFQQCLL